MIDDDDISELPDAFGYTIFCDDMRVEVGGKITYVGVYRSDMFLHGDFPVTLPKFCLAVMLDQKRSAFVPNVTFRVYFPGDPDDAPSLVAEVKQDKSGAALEGIVSRVQPGTEAAGKTLIRVENGLVLSPAVFNQPGSIKVRAVVGDKIVKLGRLEVFRAPAPKTN